MTFTTPLLLSQYFGNPEESKYYKIEGNSIYFSDYYVGDIEKNFDSENNKFEIKFKPNIGINKIEINFTIGKVGIDF
jgi:hypothetical protein